MTRRSHANTADAHHIHPSGTKVYPAAPFAVMWNISAWCESVNRWYRFIDPRGTPHTFRYRALVLGTSPTHGTPLIVEDETTA